MGLDRIGGVLQGKERQKWIGSEINRPDRLAEAAMESKGIERRRTDWIGRKK